MQQSDAPGPMLPGFDVLFEREILDARRSKRLYAFAVIMTLALLLIVVIAYANVGALNTGARHEIETSSMNRMLGTWAYVVGFLGSLMVIAASVDAVTSERALGLTSWIITKPVSRVSYLLAKASAHALVASMTLVILPSAVWVIMTFALFRDVPAMNIVVAAAILCVEMVFLSFTVVALGVVFRSVAPIAILSLALWFLPNVVPAIESLRWTYRVLPSYLPIAALSVAVDDAQSFSVTIPLVSILIAAIVFVGAVTQFERQEL